MRKPILGLTIHGSDGAFFPCGSRSRGGTARSRGGAALRMAASTPFTYSKRPLDIEEEESPLDKRRRISPVENDDTHDSDARLPDGDQIF